MSMGACVQACSCKAGAVACDQGLYCQLSWRPMCVGDGSQGEPGLLREGWQCQIVLVAKPVVGVWLSGWYDCANCHCGLLGQSMGHWWCAPLGCSSCCSHACLLMASTPGQSMATFLWLLELVERKFVMVQEAGQQRASETI